MFSSHVLETAAGLAFIYFTLSTFASAISEWIAALLSLRAKDLEKEMKNLLGQDPPSAAAHPPAAPAMNMATALMNHSLIQNLCAPKLAGKGVSGPAYLEAKIFSAALFDLLAPGHADQTFAGLRQAVNNLPNQDLKNALLPLLDRAGGNLDAARQNIETWFDSAMDRLSGLYKRRTQWILFALGLALAVILNVDTLRATTKLWNDPVLREHLVQEAGNQPKLQNPQAPKDQKDANTSENMAKAEQSVMALYSEKGMPIGWSQDALMAWKSTGWLRLWSVFIVLVGWLFTAIAVSLGAPFWFDFLNKTLNLNARLNGPKPSKSAKNLTMKLQGF